MSKSTRSKLIKSSTSLEYFPNEIFVSIFSYLSGVDAVLAFSNLNSRFYSLSNQYCYFFDFKSISKTKLDFILIQQRNKQFWKSLQLSNNEDETPGQIEYFCQLYSLSNICPQLESLSLLNIEQIHNNEELLTQLLLSSSNLQSLTIEPICATVLSNINLSQLKRLVIHSCKNIGWMKDLSQLENLEYTMTKTDCACPEMLTWPLSLKRLKIVFREQYDLISIQNSFINLSQLITLEIYQNKQKHISMTPSIAQRWEQLIHSFFPQLKHFRFYFYVRIIHGSKPITSSFSTPFYLLEKKWFVRCDKFDNYSSYQSHMLYNNEGAVYSLPLIFQPSISMCNGNRVLSIDSTLPNALNNDDLYSNHFVNIKKLVFNGDPNYLDKNYKQNNIVNLTIQQSFTSHTWIQVLTKLRHLSLHKNAQMSTDTFHYLLEHTPELDSLVIDNNLLQNLTDNGNHSAICHHLSNKIRYLKFHSATNACQCFNKHKLSEILPIFASKCQHLSLSIQSKLDLIGFVLKRMKRLHSLHIHMTEKDHQPINMEWFDEQKAKFSFSNCFIVKREQDYYFWLGKSF